MDVNDVENWGESERKRNINKPADIKSMWNYY